MRRGHVLMLVMLSLVAFSTLGMVIVSRHSVQWQARKPDAIRRQALWLARSAAQPGAPVIGEVETALGKAKVSVTRANGVLKASAVLAGGVAEVGTDASGMWIERYRTP